MSTRWCAGALVIALCAGCGSGGYKTVPVSGKVRLDGKPLADATLMFVPIVDGLSNDPPPSSVGTTNKDGNYDLVISSNAKRKGAVTGMHKVFITLGAKGASAETKRTYHRHLPAEYNRKTKLECEIPAGGRKDADFDLKLR